MPSDHTHPPSLHPESTREVLDVLGSGIAKLTVGEGPPYLKIVGKVV